MTSALGKLNAQLIKAVGWFLVVSFAALTLDVLWGVFSRYILGAQSRWTEELAIYLMVWVSMLGAAVTYAEHGHLGVDYFVGKMDPAAQRLTAIVVELMVLFFCVFALTMGGVSLVKESFAAGQISPAMGVPMGYVYLSVPLSGVFFTLFSLEQLLKGGWINPSFAAAAAESTESAPAEGSASEG